MEYTYLGETGLEVSRLCLGCGALGSDEAWRLGDDEAGIELVESAVERGINFFGTANVYSDGESERVLGDAIENRRDELVVASKVHGEMADRPNGGGLSRKHVLEAVQGSLDRLGTDYLDLYYLHRWDENTPIEETLSALDHLVDEGLVRYVGASTMAGWQLTKGLRTSDVEHYERFVAVQPEYSAVRRHEEVNALPVARDQGLGVVPWSPLAAGFLTGEYDRGDDLADRSADRTWRDLSNLDRETNWAVLDAVRAIADQRDATPVQVSLAWLLAKDVVDAPILGARIPAHVEEATGALELSLTDEEVERLEASIDPAWPPAHA